MTAPDPVPAELVFGETGLLPAIIQDDVSGEVLMLAWMDREAVRRTLTTGRVTFWSRSRREYWRKGDTSGHRQYVRGVAMDCDGDTLLVRVIQIGAACHTGTRSCFTDREIPALVGDPDAEAGSGGAAAPGADA
ncbi:phosphoribosyl-AMP cyclohydrolase [Leucobacter allii]|uniref:Phosphoribosyl-AMP cyclohydrolase n=1 Tax=Leucobacter allii TaxID=2932247 RepID=A0ABY4FQ27_9MICO|nr:phosphoribosyl-AMP cyclohydrolase [Leucobacter allii]UOQ58385.1 phosphoribosyl-AMP cyclohydrolase [Leucobacter allii]UOR02964.1 phosphoribosyl-AMP cyclohydrolase [Leucobacter allii]